MQAAWRRSAHKDATSGSRDGLLGCHALGQVMEVESPDPQSPVERCWSACTASGWSTISAGLISALLVSMRLTFAAGEWIGRSPVDGSRSSALCWQSLTRTFARTSWCSVLLIRARQPQPQGSMRPPGAAPGLHLNPGDSLDKSRSPRISSPGAPPGSRPASDRSGTPGGSLSWRCLRRTPRPGSRPFWPKWPKPVVPLRQRRPIEPRRSRSRLHERAE